MWTRALLKENAKIAFKRNYWTCVIAAVILMLVGGGASGTQGTTLNFNFGGSSAAVGGADANLNLTGEILIWASVLLVILAIAALFVIAFSIFVTNVIMIGGKRYFMENREHKTSVGQVFYGFQGGNYLSCVKTMFFKDLYLFGWTLLFVIPGIIKSYSYQLVPYILAENPTLSKDRAIELSCQMMDGHKFESFILGWSFIGWDFLNALTVGILGIFYVNPYKHATYAEFYTAIKAEAFNRGITDHVELPGVSNKVFQEEVPEAVTGTVEDIFAED